jgi:hypothetical protein
MDIKQVQNILKPALAQALGAEYMGNVGELSAIDDRALADIGQDLFNKSVDPQTGISLGADVALKELADRCGKVVIESERYYGQVKSVFIDPREWGGFLIRYYFGLGSIMNDEMWNSEGFIDFFAEGGQEEAARIAAIEHGYYKPAVSGKAFMRAAAHMIPITTLRDQFFSAFLSWEAMDEFLGGITTMILNTIEALAQVKAKALLGAAIVASVQAGNEIHLVTEYNAEYGAGSVTAENALSNKDFIAWAYSRIDEIKGNMSDLTEAYSAENNLSFTSERNWRLILHKRLPNRARYLLRSSSFNEGLLSIGEYDEINSWQAVREENKADFDFDTTSSVYVTPDVIEYFGGTKPEEAVRIEKVIGLAFDRRTLGISLKKDDVTQSYTASRKSWNSFYHALFQQILDRKFKAVVFTLS